MFKSKSNHYIYLGAYDITVCMPITQYILREYLFANHILHEYEQKTLINRYYKKKIFVS